MSARTVTLVPAYGRDYKRQADVVAAWEAGKDFLIADISTPYDGKPVNLEDARGVFDRVRIRYMRLARIVEIKVPPRPQAPGPLQ